MMDINDLELIAQARFEHEIAKQNLKEKVDQQLIFAYGNGLFRADPALISFLNCWDDDDLVIEDLHHNPVRVNRLELLERAKQCYQYALNAWLIEHENIKKMRKARDV